MPVGSLNGRKGFTPLYCICTGKAILLKSYEARLTIFVRNASLMDILFQLKLRPYLLYRCMLDTAKCLSLCQLKILPLPILVPKGQMAVPPLGCWSGFSEQGKYRKSCHILAHWSIQNAQWLYCSLDHNLAQLLKYGGMCKGIFRKRKCILLTVFFFSPQNEKETAKNASATAHLSICL